MASCSSPADGGGIAAPKEPELPERKKKEPELPKPPKNIPQGCGREPAPVVPGVPSSPPSQPASGQAAAGGGSFKNRRPPKSGTVPTAPAPKNGRRPTAVLSCAYADCLLQKEFERRGWNVVVITEQDDITSEFGLNKALNAITHEDDILWHSQPCTGGCPWQIVNAKRGAKTRKKVQGHWHVFRKFWTPLLTLP